MIKRRSCSLSTKVNWNFDDILKIHLTRINNANIFTIHEYLIYNVMKILPTIYQNNPKVPGKCSKSGFKYKER